MSLKLPHILLFSIVSFSWNNHKSDDIHLMQIEIWKWDVLLILISDSKGKLSNIDWRRDKWTPKVDGIHDYLNYFTFILNGNFKFSQFCIVFHKSRADANNTRCTVVFDVRKIMLSINIMVSCHTLWYKLSCYYMKVNNAGDFQMVESMLTFFSNGRLSVIFTTSLLYWYLIRLILLIWQLNTVNCNQNKSYGTYI